MAPSNTPVGTTGRLAWVDNLRVAAITGVIVVHTATAYVTDFADWYYDDELHPTTAGFAVFAIPALMGGIFGLGPLFWLAGWFSGALAPPSRSRPFRDHPCRPARRPACGLRPGHQPAGRPVGNVRQEDRSFLDYLAETEFSVTWFVAALLFASLGYAGLRACRPRDCRPTATDDRGCTRRGAVDRRPLGPGLAGELAARRAPDEPAAGRLAAGRGPLRARRAHRRGRFGGRRRRRGPGHRPSGRTPMGVADRPRLGRHHRPGRVDHGQR